MAAPSVVPTGAIRDPRRGSSQVFKLVNRLGVDAVMNELKTDAEREHFVTDWEMWQRADQKDPALDGYRFTTWLMLSGRGWGKTRVGAETTRGRVKRRTVGRIALIGATASDVRDTMVEGVAGILAMSPRAERPKYEPSKRRLTWPNGAVGACFSADEPDRLRGPQHDFVWADEPAAWKYPTETWDMMMFGLRVGTNPQVIATTTPRPIKLVKSLVSDSQTFLTVRPTYDNIENLADAFKRTVIGKYAGTRLGRQELDAEILTDTPGALWTLKIIDDTRLAIAPDGRMPVPDLARVIVGVDPATTSNDNSNETGIVVWGVGVDGRGYVLGDYSCKLSPNGWATRAVEVYREHRADVMVGEVNNGGDLVEAVVKSVDPNVNFKSVTASRGKIRRAEPIAALYEQAKVSHCGTFPELEDQMTTYVPETYDGSPDRMDALVWAATLGTEGSGGYFG